MRHSLYCLIILGFYLSLLPAQNADLELSLPPLDEPCFLEEFQDITTGNNTSTTGSNSVWNGNSNFPVYTNTYRAGGVVRLGTSSLSGNITSKVLDEISGNTSLRLDVKGWTTVEGDLIISLGSTTRTVSYSATMFDAFETITVHFADVPLNSTLSISTSAKRAFLDNIQLDCHNFIGSPTDFYRSAQSGSWNDSNSWESSETGAEGSYNPSFLYPDSQASRVQIQAQHQIEIHSPHIEMTNLDIEGTLEISGNTTFAVLGDEEIEVRVKNGGIFLVNTNGGPPNFQAKGLVESGGKLIAGPGMGGGTAFGNRYIGLHTGFFSFEDQSIVEWDNSNTVLGSTTTIDQDFFRRTSEEALPLFRIITTPGFPFGSDVNNVLNCILEIIEPASFGIRFSGEKTILGGIQGSGILYQLEDSGNLYLGNSLHSAFLDGTLKIQIQDYKFKLANTIEVKENAQVQIESNMNTQNHRIHRINGDLKVLGTLDIHNLRIENATDGGISIQNGGKIRTRHTGGLFGSGAAIVQFTDGKLLLENGSAVDYYADETQNISSVLNYYHLIFSGNGLKIPNSAINVHTNGSVRILDNPIVNFANHNLGMTTMNNTQFFMEGGRLILGTGGTQPNMNGNYFINGGVIEFTGSSEIQIRVGNNFNPKTYLNMEISGGNVRAGTSDESGLTFHPNGNFILKDNAVFKLRNQNGFIGTATSAIKNAEVLSLLELELNSTVEYNRNDSNTQSLSILENGYGNLLLSGSNTKIPNGKNLLVRNTTTVLTGELIIPTSNDDELPYVLTSQKGIQNLDGRILFENNSNLLQDIGAINLGAIEMKRNAIVPDIQYNFWSSPVRNQGLYELYPDIPTNRVMVYNSLTDFYTILPSSTNPVSEFGKGYSIKGSTSMQPAVTATFIGIPQNESLNPTENHIPLSTLGNNYNLIGNPFPSNLDLVKVFQENQFSFYDEEDESPGFLFWDNTDNDDLIQQGSNYVNQNFALFNPSSQIGIPAPRFGTMGKIPNGIVKPGQGFILRADETATHLNLKNSMRTTEMERNGLNSEYYKNPTSEPEKHQFQLTLTLPNNLHLLIAIGYFEEAENHFERFDSSIFSENTSDNFYSLSTDKKKLIIQGKAMPFQKSDEIPLGYKSLNGGKFKIGLHEFQGDFEEIPIYLWDKKWNQFHDLKDSDYEFESLEGEFRNRYSIVFHQEESQFSFKTNSILISQTKTQIILQSLIDPIMEIEFRDLNGHLIYRETNRTTKEIRIEKHHFRKGIHFIQIQTDKELISQKIILE
jgi:hypothetical protein